MGKRGFSIIELMIVALIISALGMGVSIYMKRSSVQLRSGDQSDSLRTQVQLAESILKNELQQIAFINPSCAENPPTGLTPTNPCANVRIRGGFTPYPGESYEDMNARIDMSLSANLTADPASLSFESDAARLVLFNFDQSYQCPLDVAVSTNPSDSTNELWADGSCTGLEVGKLYVLMEELGGRAYANVFQITSLAGGGASAWTIEVEPGGLYNQDDPLGDAQFSNNARIYPIKLVELGVSETGGFYRREIDPSSSDLAGYQTWSEVLPQIEGIQFNMLTVTSSEVVSHSRTLSQLTSDTLNNGVEDVRGVSPRFVVRSDREHPDKLTFDNPLTATIENDHFPRQEKNFYINFKNANLN